MQTAVRSSDVWPLPNGLAGLLRRILEVLRGIAVACLAHASAGIVLRAVGREVDRLPLFLMAVGADRSDLAPVAGAYCAKAGGAVGVSMLQRSAQSV
jgi:hypothetical protein